MLLDTFTHLQDMTDDKFVSPLKKMNSLTESMKLYCLGVSPEDWSLVSNIVYESGDIIVPFFGIHPCHVNHTPPGWENQLKNICVKHIESGVGEIGLDKATKATDYEKQKEIFKAQVNLSEKLLRPMVISCVQAWDDLYSVLSGINTYSSRFMIKAYDGPSSMLKKLLDLGGFISFSHRQLASGKEFIKNLLADVPLDRLLVGTDYPFSENRKIEAVTSYDKYLARLRETYTLARQGRDIEEAEFKKTLYANGDYFVTGHKNPKDKKKLL